MRNGFPIIFLFLIATTMSLALPGSAAPGRNGTGNATPTPTPTPVPAATPTPTATPSPTPIPSPTPVATVESGDGQPITIRFKDGREAMMKYANVDSAHFKSSFQVADNNCSNRQNMKCTYNYMLRFYRMVVIWTTHPDTTKLGKPVQRVTEYMGPNGTIRNTNPLEVPFIMFTGGPLSKKYPAISAGLPAHEIECDDFSWLPGEAKDAPLSLQVSRWDSEDNVANPETGYNENRTVGGANGVKLTRTAINRMRIDSAERITGDLTSFDILNLRPTLSLTMKLNDHEICQTGLSSNLLADAQGYFPKLLDQLQNKITPQVYIQGSPAMNELMQQSNVSSNYQRWVMEFTSVQNYSPLPVYE